MGVLMYGRNFICSIKAIDNRECINSATGSRKTSETESFLMRDSCSELGS